MGASYYRGGMRLICLVAIIAALTGCTKSDEERVKQKARETKEDLKRDLKTLDKKVEKGLEKARKEIRDAVGQGETDRKR